MGGYDDARAAVERDPTPAALDAFIESAVREKRVEDAILVLRPLYATKRTKALWDALGRIMSWSDWKALPPPEDARPESARELPRAGYASLLRGAFLYPFTSVASVVILVVGGCAFGVAQIFLKMIGPECLCGSIVAMAVAGFFVAFLFTVLRESTQGSRRAPGWRQSVNVVEAIGAFWRWTVATVVCAFVPSLLVVFWLGARSATHDAIALPLLFAAGAAALAGLWYHPMSLMAAACADSWMEIVMIPRGLRAIRSLGREYGLCVGVFALTSAVGSLLPMLILVARPEAVAVALPLSMWGGFYGYMVQMRATGLLYYVREPLIR